MLPSPDVRAAAAWALFTLLTRLGHADPRDSFGFAAKSPAPLDCASDRDVGCAQATAPFADQVPFALTTWLPAAYLLSLPVGHATHDDVASYALGAARDDAGPNFGGNGLENRWTIDGAPADDVRTGAADARIPLPFLDGIVVTAGGFAARDRTSTGGTIEARLKRGTPTPELDVRTWVELTGKARHMPVPPQSYQLRTLAIDRGPDVGASVVATGPLGTALGARAWYAAGIAPELSQTKFAFSAASIVDADHDGVPDGLPGRITTQPIESTAARPLSWSVPAMLRLGFDGASQHLELSLVGSANSSARFLANSTLQAGGVDAINAVGDGIATWRGEWDSTRARVQAAWHRSVHRESARYGAAGDIPQLLSAYVPSTLADDPVLARACMGGTANLPNCPVPIGWFASGGAGPLVDTTGDRPSLSADVARHAGNHVLRAGATGEDARLVTTSRLSGGEQLLSLFPGEAAQRRYIDPTVACPDDPAQSCGYATESQLRYRTRYVAAYLEDTWRAAPDISVDGGVRWELMWVGSAVQFSNQLSPRLGWTWDPLGGGRSRVWTSMGRSFAMLPAGIGAAVLRRDATATDVAFGSARVRTVDNGAPLTIAPALLPISQDELTVGGQLALARQFVITGWLQGKWLRHGIESTPNGLDNPGRSGAMTAQRETTTAALELATALTAKLALRVGYMYAHTVGSWTGAYDPRNGAVLYNSSDFDASPINELGALPSDAGHRLYIEAQRRGRIAAIDIAVATRFTVASGAPRDALGQTDNGIVYLIGRGEAGRGPLVTQTNVRITAGWRGFEVYLDVFNLFDHRDATNLDPVYASGSIRPIDGGSAQDLVFLKTDSGQAAARRPAYRVGTEFQAPISALLGLHHAF